MDDRQVKDFYNKKIFNYFAKNKAMAVGWGSYESQETRFKILLGILPIRGICTLLDIGCGLGALFRYLQVNKNPALSLKYYGIDFMAEMVGRARTATGLCQEIQKGDILTTNVESAFDFVVASGIFTHRDYAYLELAIENMFRVCKRAIAFNCLKQGFWAEKENPHEFYADPERVYKFCKERCHDSELIKGYLPNDFTIYMRK